MHINRNGRLAVVSVLGAVFGAACLSAQSAPDVGVNEEVLSLEEADEAMGVLKGFCLTNRLAVRYLGACGSTLDFTAGGHFSGSVWNRGSSGRWEIADQGPADGRPWLVIEIRPPSDDEHDAVLHLTEGELHVAIQSAVTGYDVTPVEEFRFRDGRSVNEFLSDLTETSKSHRRRETRPIPMTDFPE